MFALALLPVLLLTTPPLLAAEAPAKPAAAPAPHSSVGLPTAWIGDEDVLAMVQGAASLGASLVVAGVGLFPAATGFSVLSVLALAANAPWLLVLAPAGLLAGLVLAQAVVSGFLVWGISHASEHFEARAYVPRWIPRFLNQRTGQRLDQGVWKQVLGAPWLTGFSGYLAGAAVGAGMGMSVALPLWGVALLLVLAAPGNVAAGFAGVVAVLGGLTALVVAESLVAPLGAAVAHHLTKEVLPMPGEP